MILVRPIPIYLAPARLSQESRLSEAEAASFLENARPLLDPVGVFEEVDPETVPVFLGPDRESKIIIGVCSLGPQAVRAAFAHGSGLKFWSVLCRVALHDVLDFLSYRIRLYLKPTGRQPGTLLVPGCRELPLSANQAVIDHFGQEMPQGLTVLPSGEIDGRAALVFAYLTARSETREAARCADCTRRDCPARM